MSLVYHKNTAWRRNPAKFARALAAIRERIAADRELADGGRYVVRFLTRPPFLNWAVLDSEDDDQVIALYGYAPEGKDSALMRAYYMNQEEQDV